MNVAEGHCQSVMIRFEGFFRVEVLRKRASVRRTLGHFLRAASTVIDFPTGEKGSPQDANESEANRCHFAIAA